MLPHNKEIYDRCMLLRSLLLGHKTHMYFNINYRGFSKNSRIERLQNNFIIFKNNDYIQILKRSIVIYIHKYDPSSEKIWDYMTINPIKVYEINHIEFLALLDEVLEVLLTQFSLYI